MKYLNSVLLKSVSSIALIFMIQACENEFSEIGPGIVGTPNFEIQNKSYPITTYTKRITPFQSDGLSSNLLGYYFDPVFGSSKVNFVGQLTPNTFTPDFGETNRVLDSVVLTVPYESTEVAGDTNTYKLDSLYGGKTENDAIKLSIYKNDYYLRTFDPAGDLEDSQKYFSDGSLTQEEIIGSELEGQLLYEGNYLPSEKPIGLKEINEETGALEVTSTLDPSLRIHLYGDSVENASIPDGFWEDLILSKEDDEALSKASSFYNYFRGLYFKVEPTNAANGTLIQLNFASTNANVKLYYSYDKSTTTDGETTTTTEHKEYEMLFSGTRLNIFDTEFNSSILQAVNDTSTNAVGDDYLYLRGGEGAMAIVELFSEDEDGNTEEDQLNEFRTVDDGVTTAKRLINEAYLEFYVETTLSNSDLPQRVYLYDIENNIPLSDFFMDQTVNPNSSDSKYSHLVPLATKTDAAGITQKTYKIRITEHLNNIIIRDSTNVKLGLVVSSNVGAANTRDFKNNSVVDGVPVGTVLSPKSVILHGNNTPDATKKAKLKIYYTEPNN